jgi:predicted transcriptional regulator
MKINKNTIELDEWEKIIDADDENAKHYKITLKGKNLDNVKALIIMDKEKYIELTRK